MTWQGMRQRNGWKLCSVPTKKEETQMKLTKNKWLRGTVRWMEFWLGLELCLMVLGRVAIAQGVSTTTVQGTVYLANGNPGAGTLDVSWPAFTTANNLAVTAGRTTVTISPDGYMSVNLAPNLGATPAGLYYTAVYHMSDGTTSTEYWVVPAAAQASLGQIRAQLMPAAQAVQAVSKAYVDQSISELTQSLLTASGGSLSGSLYLNGDPTQPLQAADKHYVDSTLSLAVPLAGGNMTGALATPTLNGVQSPLAGSGQTTLQAAVSAAGTNGAVEIPPSYTGTDGFTNPNGVYVTDLRQTSSQQFERNVKEFGAVCDGTTDDTNALQAALNYAQTHGVSLTIPQGTCKTHTLIWHGESIGGLGKQVSALMGYPGQDVLTTVADSANLLSYTRLHDLTIYVDQSQDVSCTAAKGRAPAGICAVSRLLENNSIFSQGGNGLTGTAGTGTAWAVGNCAIAMPATTGAGGNGLRVAEIENLEIAATGSDPMAAQYGGAHSTHTCGMYLAQWPQWSEFRNIDIRGLNTGIAIPALPGTAPAGLTSDSNRWQNITIQATHGFTAAAGSNNVLDNIVVMAENSAATSEPPTGLVLDLAGGQQGWTVRNAMVQPVWNAVQPQLTVAAAGGAVTGVSAGPEYGLGYDPYGTQAPVKFSGSCTAQATANVNNDGSIGTIGVTQGGIGCSGTTTASVNVVGTWDTAAPVNLISGQNISFFGGNLLSGNGGYTVWNASGSQSYGTQLGGSGGSLPGGGSYKGLVANSGLGTTLAVDQFPGADFGAKLQSCLNTVSVSYGGTCDARNFTGNQSMGSTLTIATANTSVLLPCATISTANQVVVTAGTRNVSLRGCALRGASTASGSQGGTVFLYSGPGAMVQVGDPTYVVDTMGFHMDNAVINTTTSNNAATTGLAAFRTQELDLESLYFLGNSNQTGVTLDGTGNYTGGTFYDDAFNGFQMAVNAIGHQVSNSATTDWMNASTFVRLHINCPTSGDSPISGTYGINLVAGDGNTFTGGDVEGCSTALHLGPNAQNNTIVGLRNENSTDQVVADAGSSYNNWMTGGTMFTGQLTDNGTRNSFLDTFHRSFNGVNGDWYGSQKDATVTNHFRLGTGAGNERGLLNRYQTDSGYRWTTGLSDATSGEQFYQVLDELNNVYRISIGQYNNGQSSSNNQTVVNAAGTGAVVLNGSNNSGTGGVVFGSGGASETTVATINNTGSAQFNGTLQVGGTSTFAGSPTMKNQADVEIDATLWAGLTASQKESFIYKDWNGNSQWYMVKDASNNWALNSATGGLDSFKAYQSTNSGDTYINASNPTGIVRVNYETGAGAGFNIYGGNSSALYASFTAANSIKFPGLAASSGYNCLQIDNSGYLSNTGSACGTGTGGTSGTVNTGTAGQIAYYTSSGAEIGGTSSVAITSGGTGATTSSGALTNLGIGGLSALNCGAKGDGVTDDTSALNACFSSALASHQSLYIPTPSVCYKVTSPLLFGGWTGTMQIIGDGKGQPHNNTISPICYTSDISSTSPVIDGVNSGDLIINGISIYPLNGTPSAGSCVFSKPNATGGGQVNIYNSYFNCGGGAGSSAVAIIGQDLSSIIGSRLESSGNALVIGNNYGPSTVTSHYATGAGYGVTHIHIGGSYVDSTLSPLELTGSCGDYTVDNDGGPTYIVEVNGGDSTHGIIDLSYITGCDALGLNLVGVNIENQSSSIPLATIATVDSTNTPNGVSVTSGFFSGRLYGGRTTLAGTFHGVHLTGFGMPTAFSDTTIFLNGEYVDSIKLANLSPTSGGTPGFSGSLGGSKIVGYNWNPATIAAQPINPWTGSFKICSANGGNGICYTNSGAHFNSANFLSPVTGTTFSGALLGNATTATSLAGGVANNIPYQAGAGTTGFIAPVGNALLVTNGSGVPSESTTIPNGMTATTQSIGDNTAKVATDAFVLANVANRTTTTPAWLQYLGNGADGANTNASGNMRGEYYYTNFTVPYGNTVTMNGSGTVWGLVIHATGTCTIAGTINSTGYNAGSAGYGGGSSGGSGGGTSAGTVGGVSFFNTYAQLSGGVAGSASGGNGGNGLAQNVSAIRNFLAVNTSDGGNAIGAYGRQGANSGGAAGSGGVPVVLICNSIVGTDGTHVGVINVSGGAGGPATANSTGAGSGGGGGVAILSSQQSVSTWPTVYTAGGPGGLVTVPEAVATGGSCTCPPKATLGVTSGALDGTLTVVQAGAGCGTGAGITWNILGGGGTPGTATINPVWSGGALVSGTVTPGTSSGYTAATYTNAGTGGDGGTGWYQEFQGW